jgi:NAD(P)-dependent dehydrogenase (short-subunit alcohol dehydrogenase family)
MKPSSKHPYGRQGNRYDNPSSQSRHHHWLIARIRRINRAAPCGERLARPQDIANVVAFLVGPDAGWVDGQTLRVNGGMV